MDSAVAPLLARESSRATWGAGPGEHVILHFTLDGDGVLRSPDRPERVQELQPWVTRGALEDRLEAPRLTARVDGALPQAQRQSQVEFLARAKSVTQAANAALPAALAKSAEVQAGTPRPVWIGRELILARRTAEGIEGAWLDWPGLRGRLLGEVEDLFPAGALEPAAGADGAGERLMAALPARFVPGAAAGIRVDGGGPLKLVLGGAWAAVLLAGAALAALLVGTLRLSERRATFVGAVTHELRTPLTTLRSYTEMLAGGMVREEKKQGYLETLSREATRLAGLVDNVLAYARLERGRGPAPSTPQDVAALLAAARPRLEERAAAAGMRVEIDAPPGLRALADPAAIDQILFNLVDNASKYAGGGAVRVRAARDGGRVVLRVADDGPGVGAEERRALFEPFARPAERAAGSAPGVGLGLALCRRLARAMGGDLVLEDGPGCVFALRLRAA
jgi:signal transduction histidine kinase